MEGRPRAHPVVWWISGFLLLVFLSFGVHQGILGLHLFRIYFRVRPVPDQVTVSQEFQRPCEKVHDLLKTTFHDPRHLNASGQYVLHGGIPVDVDEVSIHPEIEDSGRQFDGTKNPRLDWYRSLEDERRKFDFLLVDYSDKPSREFRMLLGQAAFKCDLIVHLECLAAQDSRIEIIELNPRVYLGAKLGLMRGHLIDFPGEVGDNRLVTPTTYDRVTVLEEIEAMVR